MIPSTIKKEIEEFFLSFNLKIFVDDVNIESYSYKTEKCNVTVKDMNCDSYSIAHFEMVPMPGCCGIAISTNCWVSTTYQNIGIGQFLHELRIKLAKEWGYGLLLCTDVETNTIQKHILKKNNWEQLYQFRNPRTKNIVNLHALEL